MDEQAAQASLSTSQYTNDFIGIFGHKNYFGVDRFINLLSMVFENDLIENEDSWWFNYFHEIS
jgi:hypothetical protein